MLTFDLYGGGAGGGRIDAGDGVGSGPQPPRSEIWCGEEWWRSGNSSDRPIKIEERMDEQTFSSQRRTNILAGGFNGVRDLLTLAKLSLEGDESSREKAENLSLEMSP